MKSTFSKKKTRFYNTKIMEGTFSHRKPQKPINFGSEILGPIHQKFFTNKPSDWPKSNNGNSTAKRSAKNLSS